jgi:hypothetical protein
MNTSSALTESDAPRLLLQTTLRAREYALLMAVALRHCPMFSIMARRMVSACGNRSPGVADVGGTIS